MRGPTPRTTTCYTLIVVITSGTGSRNTPCSTIAIRESTTSDTIQHCITYGNNTRGITDNTLTIRITNDANNRRVSYTTLSNSTTSRTISRYITHITLTIRTTGSTTTWIRFPHLIPHPRDSDIACTTPTIYTTSGTITCSTPNTSNVNLAPHHHPAPPPWASPAPPSPVAAPTLTNSTTGPSPAPP